MNSLKKVHVIYRFNPENGTYAKINNQLSAEVIHDLPYSIKKTKVNRFSKNLCFGLKVTPAYQKPEFTFMHKTNSKKLYYGTARVHSSDNLLILYEDDDLMHIFMFNDMNYTICPKTKKLAERLCSILLPQIQKK